MSSRTKPPHAGAINSPLSALLGLTASGSTGTRSNNFAVKRAANGYIFDERPGDHDSASSVATSIDEVIAALRTWAAPAATPAAKSPAAKKR